MTRNVIWLAFLVAVIAAVAGCGGGGGGNPDPDPQITDKYVVTGIVKDYNTNAVIAGALVRIGSYQIATNSSGRFTIEMTSTPIVTTYSINGEAKGYFSFWAYANDTTQNATCIVLPLIQKGTNSLGTIYLLNDDTPPPFPPTCPK
jgi:hypothetical protein